ncbi:hypothetical protein CV770_21670 [Bradyrhizobium sp. AC87j1]|nr:hypothetical protein CV770_21670 [Bradyrhizobium sp. AC87j1]
MGALKLVVHLAGDLEQPLHASEHNGDQGGDTLHVILHAKRFDDTSYTRVDIPQHVGDFPVDLQTYSWGVKLMRWMPIRCRQSKPRPMMKHELLLARTIRTPWVCEPISSCPQERWTTTIRATLVRQRLCRSRQSGPGSRAGNGSRAS